ncbi:maleylacetate reductase [Caballeronia sp. J97]|uniref:maleylacetate reductase n=1 Tax=Caballeronia sp. J97 TaxID=2805429 RepID=UPI002AB0BBAF|nr:maleylacetate reductase [Caballeronia sp. J97]
MLDPISDRPFVYSALPSRVVFGYGTLQQLTEEVDRIGASRALILCTPQQAGEAEAVASILGSKAAGVFSGAQMHVPIEVAREARHIAETVRADCAIAIGGGSTIGLGKAIALESSIPIIAIPTTYAGSEMTPIFGITEAGRKVTGRDVRVLPKTVIYDPALSRGLPLGMSMVSGINAIAHACEGLYARDGNPIMSIMAEEGIRNLSGGLRRLATNNSEEGARKDCLYGAWLCGAVLGHVGMALHHKLCHTLGGSFNLPHAETHTIVLPHALAYNNQAAPEAMRRIARALNTPSAPAGAYDLARELGAPVALKDLGMSASDVEKACDIALANPYWNPRPIERESLMELLVNAWVGKRPD